MNKRTLSVCGAAMFLSLLVSSAFGYEKEIERLSAQMAEKIAGKGKKTVAVVDFTDLEGNVTRLGRFIAEELSGSLSKGERGFEVVNRSNLKQLIKEYELFSTGAIDQKKALKLGEFSGIEALIIGTITPLTENIRVLTSAIDIKTAKLIDNEKENIPRTKDINELLEKEISPAANIEYIDPNKSERKASKSDNGYFFDDFNIGPKPDWKNISGNWSMSDGKYIVTDINPKIIYTTFIDKKEWNDFIMKIDVTPGYIAGEYVVNICPRVINCQGTLSSQNKICFSMGGRGHKFNSAYWFVSKEGNIGDFIGKVPIEKTEGQSLNIKIEVKKGVFTSYIDGVKTNQVSDNAFSSGTIELSQYYQYWNGEKIRIAFDNLTVTPLAN